MVAHIQIKVDDITNNLNLSGCSHSQPTSVNVPKLWILCLGRMTYNCWYWFFPSKSSSAYNICFGIGYIWDLCTPLLVDLGYLFKNGDALKINVLNFNPMHHDYDGGMKTHMANSYPKGENRKYFVCRGELLFEGPTLQRKSTENNKNNYSSYNRTRYFGRVNIILKIDYIYM